MNKSTSDEILELIATALVAMAAAWGFHLAYPLTTPQWWGVSILVTLVPGQIRRCWKS